MIIFYSRDSDPMLLDSFSGMTAIHEKLIDFLQSNINKLELPADVNYPPEPYERLLSGLRIVKSDGRIFLRMDEQDWLELSGTPENLEKYVSYFKFEKEEEGNHHHPEYVFENGQPRQGYLSAGSLNLIIELD